MAEFEVTLSAMQDAATNISNYTQPFKEEADQVYQAVQTLSEGWVGDASAEFADNMQQLHQWMTRLSETLDAYSAALNKARGDYDEADRAAARNFGG